MQPFFVALLIIGLGEIALAIYFLTTIGRQNIRVAVGLLCAFTALWVVAGAFIIHQPQGIHDNVLSRSSYFFGPFIIFSLLYFIMNYPYENKAFDKYQVFWMYAVSLVIGLLGLFSHEVVVKFVSDGMRSYWQNGQLFWLYGGTLTLGYLIVLYFLFKKLRVSTGIIYRRYIAVFVAIIIGGLPGVLFDLFLPMFLGQSIYPVAGPLSTSIWLGVVSYIVLRA